MNEILLFFPALTGGGVERNMLNLASGLQDMGYRVSIAVAESSGSFKNAIPENVKFYDLKVNLSKNNLITAIKPLSVLLRTKRFDVVISAQSEANIILCITKILNKLQCKIVITERSSITRFKNKKPIKKIIPLMMKLLYRFSDKLVAVSRDMEKQFDFLPSEKTMYIYNPIVDTKLLDMSLEKIDDKWFRRDQKYIITAGRMVDTKRFDLLLIAFEKSGLAGEFKMIILGEGKNEEKIKKQVIDLGLQDFVIMPGFVQNPYKYFNASEIFVLSSTVEGLPNVLVQAMACKCKVISTDCPTGPREILMDGQLPRLIPVNDVESLVDSLQEAAVHNYDQRLYDRALEFSREASLEGYDRLIKSLLGK